MQGQNGPSLKSMCSGSIAKATLKKLTSQMFRAKILSIHETYSFFLLSSSCLKDCFQCFVLKRRRGSRPRRSLEPGFHISYDRNSLSVITGE